MNTLIGITSSLAIIFAGSIHIFHHEINVYFMGFFRDLSRIKARNRRMANSMALAVGSKNSAGLTKEDLKMLFFGQEDQDPLNDVEIQMDSEGNFVVKNDEYDTSNLAEYTREELYEFGDGYNEEDVILISLYGRVYDVSKGSKYYGEDGKYNIFAGRDVTRALSTGCLAESCLGPTTSRSSISSSDDDYFELNSKTIREGKKWISFFETHDSYNLVGFLKDGRSMDDLIDEQLGHAENED
mmetsp:Transcript_30581/g.35656  ORF Transcript_30581/g.35656 Transcript_30581/m.35656 type:complete len:241 (+) Transcript_30581:145-867(+)